MVCAKNFPGRNCLISTETSRFFAEKTVVSPQKKVPFVFQKKTPCYPQKKGLAILRKKRMLCKLNLHITIYKFFWALVYLPILIRGGNKKTDATECNARLLWIYLIIILDFPTISQSTIGIKLMLNEQVK